MGAPAPAPKRAAKRKGGADDGPDEHKNKKKTELEVPDLQDPETALSDANSFADDLCKDIGLGAATILKLSSLGVGSDSADVIKQSSEALEKIFKSIKACA